MRVCSHFRLTVHNLLTVSLAVFIFVIFALSQRASALEQNTAGLPSDPVLSRMNFWNQTTNPNWSSGNSCGGNGNAQFPWITLAGSTTARSITVEHDQNTVNLQFNSVGANCDSIVSGNGQDILDYTLKQTHVHVLSSSVDNRPGSWTGTVSNLNGKELDIDYNPAQFFKQRYTAIVSTGFSISGLNALPEGTHTIWVIARARYVNRFEGADYNYKCVENGNPAWGGIDDPTCPDTPVEMPITITVKPEPIPPTISCSLVTISAEPNAYFNQPTSFTISGGRHNTSTLNVGASSNTIGFTVDGLNPTSMSYTADQTFTVNISGTAPDDFVSIDGHYRVSVTGGATLSRLCPFRLSTHAKPYFRVYGGDVLAGAGARPGPDTSDCINGAAQIASWARGGGALRYFGSGSQLATFALNKITDFSSGQAHAPYNNPDNLTFASSGTPGGFGGNFGQSNVSCATGYWQTSGVDDEPGPNLNATGAGTYRVDGSYVLEAPGNNDLNNGQRITIYVDGDVFIDDDITYLQDAVYENIADMPAFRLIARGNIYIDADVRRLDGLFVSMPRSDGTGGGTFYSCAKNHNGTFKPPTEAQLQEGHCRWTFLTVYGAVIADTVKLNRTGGSLADSGSSDLDSWYNNLGGPSGPAERFIFSPELWLTGAFRPGGGVDSIRTLPPVL